MATLTENVGLSAETGDRSWLLGLAHVAAVFAMVPFFGVGACVAGLLVATLVGFVVYVPMTVLALNGGAALGEDEDAPALPSSVRLGLLAAWTVTAWGVAAFVG